MINGGHLLGGGSHQIRKLIQLVVVIAIFSDDWCTWYTLRIWGISRIPFGTGRKCGMFLAWFMLCMVPQWCRWYQCRQPSLSWQGVIQCSRFKAYRWVVYTRQYIPGCLGVFWGLGGHPGCGLPKSTSMPDKLIISQIVWGKNLGSANVRICVYTPLISHIDVGMYLVEHGLPTGWGRSHHTACTSSDGLYLMYSPPVRIPEQSRDDLWKDSRC